MRPQSIDTPPDVERVQIERLRNMGPAGRLKAALELTVAVDRLALAGIRLRHGSRLPTSEERLRLYALRLTAEEMKAAFGFDGDGHDD